MTVAMASPFPVLSAALWFASVAVSARSACRLTVFIAVQRAELAGRVHAWQAAAFGLTSATLLSVETWLYGVLLGVVAAVCAGLWRRERKHT